MGFQVLDMEEFIEMRWRTYKNALNNKDKIAKEHGCPVECVYIGEPPVAGEVYCDICNAKVEGPNVILDDHGSYLYCDKCASGEQS